MAKFCTKCGRRLEEGEICNCIQTNQQASSQEINNQERTKEAQWVNEKKEALVSGTRNMFSEIVPIIKMPVTATKNIAAKNSSSIGMQFIIVKATVLLVLVLVLLGKISDIMGSYMELPYMEIIFIAVAMTVGVDCLEALVMKVITGVANGITSWNEMVTMTGVRALYETIIVLVTVALWQVSEKVGIFAGVALFTVVPYIQYSSYQVLTRMKEDKKPYIFFIGKLCMAVIIYFFVSLVAENMMGSAIGELKSMMGSFL